MEKKSVDKSKEQIFRENEESILIEIGEKKFIDPNEIEEKVEIILRQTNYSKTEAIDKLNELDQDHIKVIKSYLGLTEKKEQKISSINQEIYKQIRYKLDSNLRDYKIRVEKGGAKQLF